jgi:hypothetical protein
MPDSMSDRSAHEARLTRTGRTHDRQAGEVCVRRLAAGDEAGFTTYVSSRADATLYHTLSWRDFIVNVFRHRPMYFVAERAGRATGVLPSFLVSMPLLGSKIISLPYDIGSGGPLADDEDSERALAAAVLEAGRRQGVGYVELRLNAESPVLEALGLAAARPVFLSDLAIEGRDAVWSRVKKNHKDQVRMAKRRGLRVREAESRADFEAFYRVYLTVFRNFGTPAYGSHYFRELHERFHSSRAVRLFLAESNGSVLGGLLVFCFGRVWTNKLTVCLPQGLPLGANPALYGAALDVAIDAGATQFAMGSTAPHQTGLLDFKKRWGATTREAVLYTAAIRGTAPDLGRYFNENGLAQRAWRHLPVRATQMLGGPLNRWFC